MSSSSVRDFYDDLAGDYHLIFADWEASGAQQAAVLDELIGARLGPERRSLLDCACGIGTQAIGLARRGHTVVGSDVSPRAAARAAAEARARGVHLPTTAADMRHLPFTPSAFDIVLCADNSLAHLLTAEDITAALRAMRRVLRDGGLLLATVRDYDDVRNTRPTSRPVQVTQTPDGPVLTFQLWHWHADGERYDLDHVQLFPAGESWTVRCRRTTSWALHLTQVAQCAAEAGFTDIAWNAPEETGYYQPVLTARR